MDAGGWFVVLGMVIVLMPLLLVLLAILFVSGDASDKEDALAEAIKRVRREGT